MQKDKERERAKEKDGERTTGLLWGFWLIEYIKKIRLGAWRPGIGSSC